MKNNNKNHLDKDFLEWYKDGNVLLKVNEDDSKYFATQDAQYKNRIAHNMTALFEYYTKEFINQ
tara:strand:- start:486 stop:677 length:192 start_codon:yes stop_codon:yes gene_type:complete